MCALVLKTQYYGEDMLLLGIDCFWPQKNRHKCSFDRDSCKDIETVFRGSNFHPWFVSSCLNQEVSNRYWCIIGMFYESGIFYAPKWG